MVVPPRTRVAMRSVDLDDRNYRWELTQSESGHIMLVLDAQWLRYLFGQHGPAKCREDRIFHERYTGSSQEMDHKPRERHFVLCYAS